MLFSYAEISSSAGTDAKKAAIAGIEAIPQITAAISRKLLSIGIFQLGKTSHTSHSPSVYRGIRRVFRAPIAAQMITGICISISISMGFNIIAVFPIKARR